MTEDEEILSSSKMTNLIKIWQFITIQPRLKIKQNIYYIGLSESYDDFSFVVGKQEFTIFRFSNLAMQNSSKISIVPYLEKEPYREGQF